MRNPYVCRDNDLNKRRGNSRIHVGSRCETAPIFSLFRASIRAVSEVEMSGLRRSELHPPTREDHLPPLPHILLSAEGIAPNSSIECGISAKDVVDERKGSPQNQVRLGRMEVTSGQANAAVALRCGMRI